jgi:hypothetical protein
MIELGIGAQHIDHRRALRIATLFSPLFPRGLLAAFDQTALAAIFLVGASCVRQVQQKDLRYVGPSESRSARSGLSSLPHDEFFVFAEFLHIQIAMLLEPVLIRLDSQGPDQTQIALCVRKDPHHQGTAFDFLI